MIVNELRVAGHFEIPECQVDDMIEVALRVRIYSIEHDAIDVSSSTGGYATLSGGLRVQAVALDALDVALDFGSLTPDALPADYAESAE